MKALFWILWAVALLFGLVGVYERLVTGHQLAAYGSYIPWGLWVALYVYFIGLSAGAFLLSTLVYVFHVKRLERIGKLSLFTALVALVAALLVIWFDIGHMSRFWKVYTSFAWQSMMAWMVWLYTAYTILLVFELWFALRADLIAWSARPGLSGGLARLLSFGKTDTSAAALARDARVLRVLGSIGVPLAIAFHGGVGALFGVVGARPYWNSPLMPIIFLASALASGGALLTFLVAFFWPARSSEDHRELTYYLGRITLGLLALDILLEWAEFSINLYASIPAHAEAFRLILFGQYWWVFWVVHLALGVLVPGLMLLLRGRSVACVGAASFLIAATFISVRLNIVLPGLALPQLQGLERAYTDPRLSLSYFPSMMEWLVALFVVTLGVGLFYAGYKLLPITTAKEV
ncbi:MAG: NrfD/PsrC family molybdoenzyme membrane anchor subunit [Candidatus Binatia bacterium]